MQLSSYEFISTLFALLLLLNYVVANRRRYKLEMVESCAPHKLVEAMPLYFKSYVLKYDILSNYF